MNKKYVLTTTAIVIIFTLLITIFKIQKEEQKEEKIIKNKYTSYTSTNLQNSKNKKDNPTIIIKNENNKNISKKENPLKKYIIEYKNTSDLREKIEILRKFQNKSIIGVHKEFYNLIINEKNKQLQKELAYIFFDAFSKENTNLNQYSPQAEKEIIELAMKLVENDNTRDSVIEQVKKILTFEEIEKLIIKLDYKLNDTEKYILIRDYTYQTVFSGINPLESKIKDKIIKYFPKEKIEKAIKTLVNNLPILTPDQETTKKMLEGIKKSGILNDFISKKINYNEDFETLLKDLKTKHLLLDKEGKKKLALEIINKMNEKQLTTIFKDSPELFENLQSNKLENLIAQIKNKDYFIQEELKTIEFVLKGYEENRKNQDLNKNISLRDKLTFVSRENFLDSINRLKLIIENSEDKDSIIESIKNYIDILEIEKETKDEIKKLIFQE